jgi:hypothetical protein
MCIWIFSALLLLCAGAAQAATLTLAWDASPDTDVAGYWLYWGTQPGVYVNSVNVGNQTLQQVTGLADATPYYFVVRAYNTSGMLSDPSVEVSRRVGVPMSVAGDFGGNSKSGITVFRPSAGIWYLHQSTGDSGVAWGSGTDIPVPGDYDGDGRMDVAVFRPSDGTWYIIQSRTLTAVGFQWGNGLDVPVPGDYDGDGKTDIAVFRPSNGTWYIVYSSTGAAVGVAWGNGSDIPISMNLK